MIGTIRKHSTGLWILIIGATVISFVYWGSQGRSGNRQGGRGSFGAIDGQPISEDEYLQAAKEAGFGYFFQYGAFPDRSSRHNFDEQRETFQRLFLIHKIKEYNIHVDEPSVARTANRYLQYLGQNRNKLPFDPFGGDFERFIRHELEIQQLVSLVGLSAKHITPDEARALYEREHRELATEAAFFSASNYLASVKPPSADAVSRYYTNEMSRYRIPERVQVDYVSFDLSNHLAHAEAQLTNLTEHVDAEFRQLGTNYLRIARTPEEAKARIRKELIRQQAVTEASVVANGFADALLEMEPMKADNLATLARTNGYTVHVTKPFDQETGPTEFDGGPDFIKIAFSLSPDHPIADQTIVGENAVYVIALNKQLPGEIPSLDQIRVRVALDCQYSEALALARAAGEEFAVKAMNGLTHGKTFAAACADSKVTPTTVAPISLSTRELPQVEDLVSLGQYRQIAFTTPPDHVSAFSQTTAGGLVVYVQNWLPLDPAIVEAKLPEFENLLRRARQQEAMSDWFNREANKSMHDVLVQLNQRQAGNTPRQVEP